MINKLNVLFSGAQVGRLAIGNRQIRFEYDKAWIENGLDLSPGTLLFNGNANESVRPSQFEGLPGVFNDSLPDGWGLLLMDRVFKKRFNLDPHQITPLDRLGYMGHRGMGALEYQPEILPDDDDDDVDLSDLALQAEKVMDDDTCEVLEKLRIYGGSPGGARPKVTVAMSNDGKRCLSGFKTIPANYSHWMVKFRNDSKSGTPDPVDIGKLEKAYAEMADLAGIHMPKSRLIDVAMGKRKESFFAVKRFDRDGNRKIHFLSLSGYIHANHREPCISYEAGVIPATKKLTKSDDEASKAFRLMVFNVLAHNKDDHAKNFAFIHDGSWQLSPAFDLTFSGGINNEHTTAINGSGNPKFSDIAAVAKQAKIARWDSILDEVRHAVSQWPSIAATQGLSKPRINGIEKSLRAIDKDCAPVSISTAPPRRRSPT